MSLLSAFLEGNLENPRPVAGGAVRNIVHIAIRADNVIGSGSATDPYNGGTDEYLDKLLFNQNGSLTTITENMTIRFGPGVFQTKGSGGETTGFLPLSGQRFIGSGVFQTTLQLVKAVPQAINKEVGIFRTQADVQDIEISDMTLDLNAARQPLTLEGGLAVLSLQAVGFTNGSRILLRRVRIINWATHSSVNECFPVYMIGQPGALGEAVLEDCIIEQPDFSQARETTMSVNRAYHDGARELFASTRNNYYNGDFTTGSPPLPIKVVSIEYIDSGANLKVRTKWPHRVQKDDFVLFSGSPVAALNDRFKLSIDQYPDTDPQAFLTFKLPKPAGISGTPDLNGPNLTMQRYVPKAMIVTSVVYDSTESKIKVTTPVPHLRKAGDFVRVSGALLSGSRNNRYNGSFEVLSSPVPTATEFYVNLDSGETAPSDPDSDSVIWLDRWPSEPVIIKSHGWLSQISTITTGGPHYRAPGDYIQVLGAGALDGFRKVTEVITSRSLKLLVPADPNPVNIPESQIIAQFQGMSGIMGYGARLYRNRLVSLYRGGPYHDHGPPGSEVSKDLLNFANYYYFVYQGQVSVVLWQTNADNREGRNIVYDNIIELQPFAIEAHNQPVPGGITFHKNDDEDPSVDDFPYFETLIIYDNLIRFTGGMESGPGGAGYYQYGIGSDFSREFIIEDNVIAYPSALQPLIYRSKIDATQFRKYFNNIGLNGRLIQGKNKVTGIHEEEIESLADDLIWIWSDKPWFPR